MSAPEPLEDLEGYRAIRKFVCGECFCEFYLPTGIEPKFCPFCGGEAVAFLELPPEEADGYYREPE